MTKAEALAIIQLGEAVKKAVETFERKLHRGGIDAYWYEAYPLSQLRNTASGAGYGALPIEKAQATLDDE